MTDGFQELHKFIGEYKGQGTNHENQAFTGHFSLQPLMEDRGFEITFKAVGTDGTLYHSEKSLLAPSLDEKLCLWNLNSNTPGLAPHPLKSSSKKENCVSSFVFGFGDTENSNSFREEVTLDLMKDSSITYTYSWGLPGGEFKERSGVNMAPTGRRVNHVITMVEVMERSVEFYRDKLGLEMKFQTENWTEFSAGSIIFALHGGGVKTTPQKRNSEPHKSIAGTASVSFDVPDVKKTFIDLKEKGVKFTLEPTLRQNEGIMLAVAEDPDGFEICFAERVS